MLQLNCHKEGHISRQCPSHGREVVEIASNGKIKVQLKLLELTRGKTKKQFSVAKNRPCEAGMYLTARVEDAEIKGVRLHEWVQYYIEFIRENVEYKWSVQFFGVGR